MPHARRRYRGYLWLEESGGRMSLDVTAFTGRHGTSAAQAELLRTWPAQQWLQRRVQRGERNVLHRLGGAVELGHPEEMPDYRRFTTAERRSKRLRLLARVARALRGPQPDWDPEEAEDE